MKKLLTYFLASLPILAQELEPIGDWRNDWLAPRPQVWVPHDVNPATYFRSNEWKWALSNTGGTSTAYGPDGTRLTQFPDEPAGTAHINVVPLYSHPAPSGLLVAIVDSGIDASHPDFAGKVYSNTPASYLTDTVGHGTQVASVVADTAPEALLLPIKVPVLYESAVVAAIDEAILAGARVINLSFGYSVSREPLLLKDAILRGAAQNVLFVVAALNGVGNQDAVKDYPTYWQMPNVITVGGSTRNDDLYSTYGTNIHLCAPARLIVTAVPRRMVTVTAGTNYSYLLTNAYTSGTSLAAGFVSGAAAQRLARNPGEDVLTTKHYILAGVDLAPSLAGKCATGGRLNVFKAVTGGTITGLDADFTGIYLSGPPGEVTQVDASTDLGIWSLFGVYTNKGTRERIAPLTEPQQYFRARRH